jgi:hypothetical protein
MSNANGSNRARLLRRTKRKASQATRLLNARSRQFWEAQTTLLTVLAQLGGEVICTVGTARQAIEAFTKGQLAWTTVQGAVEGEWIIKLVTQETEPIPDQPQPSPQS